MGKSKMMSAKNAWGTSTGYADKMIDQGMDSARAQQLENWHNQQEVMKSKNSQKASVAQYDEPVSVGDDDWRNLSSFGVERNEVRYLLDFCCCSYLQSKYFSYVPKFVFMSMCRNLT
jgi:hypothetical protein